MRGLGAAINSFLANSSRERAVNSVAGETEGFHDARFSNHARQQMRRRGVREVDLVLLLFGADCETPVGGGCVALSISRRRRRELLADGYSRISLDRASGIAVVQSADGEIVTVLRPSGVRGRRYRKVLHTHSPNMPKTA